MNFEFSEQFTFNNSHLNLRYFYPYYLLRIIFTGSNASQIYLDKYGNWSPMCFRLGMVTYMLAMVMVVLEHRRSCLLPRYPDVTNG